MVTLPLSLMPTVAVLKVLVLPSTVCDPDEEDVNIPDVPPPEGAGKLPDTVLTGPEAGSAAPKRASRPPGAGGETLATPHPPRNPSSPVADA